jgi:hypothetical protein
LEPACRYITQVQDKGQKCNNYEEMHQTVFWVSILVPQPIDLLGLFHFFEREQIGFRHYIYARLDTLLRGMFSAR